MDKKIVGVLYKGTQYGEVIGLAQTFPIRKETEKLVYPQYTSSSFDEGESIRYLHQIPKSELGDIRIEKTEASFRVYCCNLVGSDDELKALISKVRVAFEKEMDDRIKIAHKWAIEYKKVYGLE